MFNITKLCLGKNKLVKCLHTDCNYIKIHILNIKIMNYESNILKMGCDGRFHFEWTWLLIHTSYIRKQFAKDARMKIF